MFRGENETLLYQGGGSGLAQGPSARPVGKLQLATGSIRITRAGALVRPTAGDLLFQDDCIETGADGRASLVFVDGTTFELYADARLVLDEFVWGSGPSADRARLKVERGKYGFIAGAMAIAGRLVVETPSARIQSTRPAAAAGSLSLILVLGLIDELHAASEDINFFDEDVITYKDLEHGIFEIITKEANPQVIVVDDPGQTIELRPRGSSFSIDLVANSPGRMVELQGAYRDVYATYLLGQNDPLLLEWQKQQRAGSSLTPSEGLLQFAALDNAGGFNNAPPPTYSIANIPNYSPPQPGGSVSTPATIRALPISNDQHESVYLGPSTEENPNVALNIIVPEGEELVSVTITGLPPGQTLVDGFGNVYSGDSITLTPEAYESGLTLTQNVPVEGELKITAIVRGPGGLSQSQSVSLPLTVDLSGPVRWVNSNGGDWNDPHNWSTNAVPIPFEDVVIDEPGNYTVTSALDVTIDSVLVAAGVTLNITGGNFSAASANAEPLANSGAVIVGPGAHLTIGRADFSGTAANSGNLQVNGTFDLINLTVDNAGGTLQTGAGGVTNLQVVEINGGAVISAGLLQAITGDNAIHAASNITISAGGVLQVTGAGVTLTIDGAASFTNAGLLLAAAQGTLLLIDESIANAGGAVQADADSTIELRSITIDGGSVVNAGLLQVTSGSNAISNATAFTNTGLLLTTGAGTSLLLASETLNNAGGTLQIDAGTTVNLQSAIVTGGTVSNAGLLEATGGVTSAITNVTSFTNTGTLLSTGAGTQLLLANETLNNAGGTVQVDGGATLNLQSATINNGTVINAGLLEATAGSSAISNFTSFTNTGTLLSTGAGTSLLLLNETVNNASGTVQVDAGATLNLQTVTINAGTVHNAGLLEATAGTSAIGNATSFANTGTLLSTGTGTSLLLLNETVDNTGGTVQVDAGATLNLQTVTINAGTVINAGLLEATAGTSNAISNATSFTNTGTLLSTGAGTTLLLLNETVDNTGGIVQTTAGATINLQTVTIDDGTINNAGLLEATGGTSNTISNVSNFTNTGTLLTSGAGTSLLLLNETVNNGGGMVQVGANTTLTLQTVTINGGTVNNAGLLQADAGTSNAISNASVTNTGTLLTTDTGTSLLLLNDTVNNAGGTVQVDDGTTLNLQSTTIDGGTVTNAGLLEATAGTSTVGNATSFANTGTVLVTGSGTTLILLSETLTNTGGTVQINAGAMLELQSATINDGIITNAGVLKATSGSNTISNVDTFTNTGTLLSTGSGTTLLLLNETVDNTGGIVQTTAGATINLQTVTINNGTINNAGTLQATGGTSNIISNVTSFTNTGTLLTSGAGTSLLLLNETVNNGGGTVQVGAGTTLTLQTVTINSGTVSNAGLLQANAGTSNAISNASVTNTGTLLSTGAGTMLLLLNDIINNASGTVQNDAGATLELQSTTIDDGTVTNAGVLQATAGTSTISDATSFTNTGLLLVTGGTTTLVLSSETLTNTGGTVQIDPGAMLELQSAIINDGIITNAGVLKATSGSNTISNVDTFTNTGTLLSTGAGTTLTLLNETVDNTGGTVQVDAGATLELQTVAINNGTVVNSGTLEATAGSNTIHAVSSLTNNAGGLIQATGDGTTLTVDSTTPIVNAGTMQSADQGTLVLLTDVTNTGSIAVQDGSTVVLDDITVTGGTIELQANGLSAADTRLVISGTVTLTGGTVTLSDDPDNLIVSDGMAATLINHNAISGAGQIGDGAGGSLTLQNFGAITATGTGNPLIIDTGTIAIDNELTGILQAAAGATLRIMSDVDNDGQIVVQDGGTVVLDDLTVTGGAIALLGAMSVTTLVISGTVTLTDATVTLTDDADNRIISDDAPATLINDSDISGAGTIGDGADGFLTLDNDGTITATGTSNALIIDTGALDIDNDGTLQADAWAKLRIMSNVSNVDGQIVVLDGGTVELVGITVDGGLIDLQADDMTIAATTLVISGIVTLNGATVTLSDDADNRIISDGEEATLINNSTISGAGTIGDGDDGSLTLQNFSTITATGTSNPLIIDTGTIEVDNAGTLQAADGATLQVMSNVANDGSVVVEDGGTVELVGIAIDGGTVTNAGTLQASGGVTSTISNVTTFTNTGTLKVTGAGTKLILLNETLDNTDGTVRVDAGAELDLNGVVIVGGLLTGPGIFATVIGTTNTLDGSGQAVTIDDDTAVTVNAGVTLNLLGTINGDGKIFVAGASTINANGTILVPVDAAGLADDTLLTLTGSASLTVINLVGNLNAAGLTGTLTVTTGDNLVDNTITITTGSGATQITANGAGDTVTVHAAALANNTLLTLIGSAAFVVDGLSGDLDASVLTGMLNVTTGDAVDNSVTITTGSNNTTITGTTIGDTVTVHAALLAEASTLTLAGASNFVVDGLKGDLDASALTGTLTVATGDALDDAIIITTGTNTTTITANGAGDTVTVHAAALINNTLLTLIGAAVFVVNGLNGDLDASALTGTLTVTTGDNTVDNTVTITTGTNTSTITANGTGDTVTVHAAALADNTLLTLIGSAAFVVDGLNGDLDASALTGVLNVTTGDAVDSTISITTGSNNTTITGTDSSDTITVNASALAPGSTLTLLGSANFIVTSLVGDLDASALTGTLTVTTGDALDDAITITTGTNTTTVTANGTADTVTLNAAALADNTLLTLSGLAAFVVDGLQGDLNASALMGALDVTTADVLGLSITTGSGSNTIDAAALTAGHTLTLMGTNSVEVMLNAGNLSADSYTGNIVVTAGNAANTITTGSGADQITGGAGADILDGGVDMVADTFVFNTGDSVGNVGGSGDSGTISGYDVVFNFDDDLLDLPGMPAVALDTGGGVNGTDSDLTIDSQTVKSHSISDGIITFDDLDTYSQALTLESLADVAAVMEYLQANDLGAAGTTVAFTANIGGVEHTFVYQQVGDDPGANTLVDLSGVMLASLSGTLLA